MINVNKWDIIYNNTLFKKTSIKSYAKRQNSGDTLMILY